MLRNQTKASGCASRSPHLDSLVLARCGFNHSADYRAVMALRHRAISSTDPEERSAR